MTDYSQTDRFARGLAVASLVISVAAILVPYIQHRSVFNEQKRQFAASQKEELTVHLDPHADGPFRITKYSIEMSHVVQIPWEVTLSNTGNQQLSVIEYCITLGPPPNFGGSYSGIDGGMFTKEDRAVDLPLAIEPGESRSVLIFVGICVPAEAYGVLSAIEDTNLRTVDHAAIALAKQGLDIYGNKVTYREYAQGSYHVTFEDEAPFSQRFWLRVVTGRGNISVASARLYKYERASDGIFHTPK